MSSFYGNLFAVFPIWSQILYWTPVYSYNMVKKGSPIHADELFRGKIQLDRCSCFLDQFFCLSSLDKKLPEFPSLPRLRSWKHVHHTLYIQKGSPLLSHCWRLLNFEVLHDLVYSLRVLRFISPAVLWNSKPLRIPRQLSEISFIPSLPSQCQHNIHLRALTFDLSVCP